MRLKLARLCYEWHGCARNHHVPRTADADNHARRRTQLVDAVFRIVQRDGVEHVSVRAVAAEAGLSMGSLRHYFATQADLLAFSLAEVERRLRARLQGLADTGNPRADLLAALALLLPLTEQSRLEHQIWLAFVGRVISDPALRTLNARVYDDTRALIERLVRRVVGPAAADFETDRTYALIDGLVLHWGLRPAHWNASHLGEILSQHVESL
jgi:AcrR family transcriptional regulator